MDKGVRISVRGFAENISDHLILPCHVGISQHGTFDHQNCLGNCFAKASAVASAIW